MTIVRYIIYIPVGGSTILLTITNNDFNCTPQVGNSDHIEWWYVLFPGKHDQLINEYMNRDHQTWMSGRNCKSALLDVCLLRLSWDTGVACSLQLGQLLNLSIHVGMWTHTASIPIYILWTVYDLWVCFPMPSTFLYLYTMKYIYTL